MKILMKLAVVLVFLSLSTLQPVSSQSEFGPIQLLILMYLTFFVNIYGGLGAFFAKRMNKFLSDFFFALATGVSDAYMILCVGN